MKESEIVIAVFQQYDGTLKRRPALVLREMPQFQDLLICGISTQLRHQVADFDEIIFETDEDFATSGLDSTSLIRLGFLMVLPRREIVGSIGQISAERHHRLLKNLSDYLMRRS